MNAVLSCITDRHDPLLLILASVVCVIGIYASSAIAAHARSLQESRKTWATVSIVAAGCTAWSTHMIGLLAFNPGMSSGFNPVLTALSLAAAIAGIAAGMALAVGRWDRGRRFMAGVVLGFGIVALHYLGQASYVITGYVAWDWTLVAVSIVGSLTLFGVSMVIFVERSRLVRRASVPLLVAAIAVVHFNGMAAARLVFDPRYVLPAGTLSPSVVAPIVAGVSLGLLLLAIIGFRFTLAAKAAARRDRARLRELASLAVEGLAICDGGIIAAANQSFERLAGSSRGQLSGCPIEAVLPGLNLLDLPEGEERDAELAALDGQMLPVRVLRREVSLGSKIQTVVAVRDQRERLRTEAKMRALAFSDSLTGLPNRARFNDLLEAHVATCRAQGLSFAILLVDLDRFKLVNDTLGHAAGDTVLTTVAERLRSAVTRRDVVARLGGDEFAVLQIDIAGQAAAIRLAERIVEQLGRPYVIEGQCAEIGASIGVAIAPEDGNEPAELLRNADLALYKAKADGKNVVRAYDPQLGQQARERLELEADLRHALSMNALEVHFQPLVDARSGRIVAAEALVRWRHPERGMVSPAEFIPVAEDAGLIGELGLFVLQAACRDALSWPDEIRVAVNLSPAQFRNPQLVETVLDALAAAGLPPHRLELEITEGVLLLDEDRTLVTLKRLRSFGISLSIDDFGTGYSSLSYLRRFPFNKIKIDRSFIRNLPADKESAAIVKAIVALADALRMTITVEGVEKPEQFAFAAAAGCDQVQGFLVSRALPASEFQLLLEQRKAAA